MRNRKAKKMAEGTQGKLRVYDHLSAEPVTIYDTINFSFVPGSTLLVIVCKPEREEVKVVTRGGISTTLTVTKPPLQYILNVANSTVVFVSDSHQEQQINMLTEECEKKDIDVDTIMHLLSTPDGGSNSH
jgi:hypothetical protein